MDRRTTFITAAAIGGVLLVGSGAVAANIGVLNSADDDSIGELTADAVVQAPTSTIEAQVVDVYLDDPPVTETVQSTSASADTSRLFDVIAQQFAVENAGSVTVEQTPAGLLVSDVQANEGWTWTAQQSGPNTLGVTFVSGDTTYEFHAEVGPDGAISAGVDQPIIDIVQAPAPTATSTNSGSSTGTYSDDDHDESDHHESDDHEEHEEHEEHEGRDDDD